MQLGVLLDLQHSKSAGHVQGEGLPDVTGPTARLIRSADGSLLTTQPVPPFNNAELPGDAAPCDLDVQLIHWKHFRTTCA